MSVLDKLHDAEVMSTIIALMSIGLIILTCVLAHFMLIADNLRAKLDATTKKLEESTVHWNSACLLPPIGIPLNLEVNGLIVPAIREVWAVSSKSEAEFVCEGGVKLIGRYKWQYQ